SSPSSQTPSNENPLLEKLSPAQFDASVKFYEADQRLQPSDREQIANDLFSTLTTSTLFGLGSSVIALLAPTLYAKSRNIQPIPAANAAKLSPLRPRLHKPFLSFMLGLTSLMVVNQQTAKYKFTRQIAALEDGPNQRQADLWKAMDYHQAGMFYVYFRKTAQDPSFLIPDPRTVTKQTLHEIRFHPPKNAPEPKGPAGESHWDQVRRANGFETEPQTSRPVNDQQESSDVLLGDELEALEASDAPKSAWDAIRGRSKN
ncbi:DUF1689-domain-containing protein, partial [Suhomyces tanzawaensis NRRL Y-17324]